MNYSEKLKNPLWQRKRLEIMQRDNFQCKECGSIKDQLHVHHKYYENGKEPWENNDKVLQTLCHKCHLEKENVFQDNIIYLELIYRIHLHSFNNINNFNNFLIGISKIVEKYNLLNSKIDDIFLILNDYIKSDEFNNKIKEI
jgi:Zn finger protein HypA/HybF involved in hydrogenase expression